MPLTRRLWIQSGAAFALPSAMRGQSRASLVVLNARVHTMDARVPRAEAFAVLHGRFTAVGSTTDIRALAGPETRVLDAAGATVVPGFIDAHCHPSGVNELYGVNLNLRSIREIQEALRKKAAATPPGYWVSGFLFDDTKLSEGRPLHRRDLDAAAPDHPVSVAHRGGHTVWYNSKAFQLAGVTKATPDPVGGRFFRDPDGEPSGKTAEHARDVFRNVGRREEFTPEQQRARNRAGMRHMSELLTAQGLTTVHDAGAGSGRERIVAYYDAHRNGELRHRAYILIPGPQLLETYKRAGLTTGAGNEWVRIGGVKFVADGSASERTMYMSTPYVGTNDRGILTMSQKEIDEAVEDAHRHGFQIGIHANGDLTIDMVLKAYERVLRQWPHPDRRHRIEHCSLVNPDLLRRIKALNVIPTPFWTYVYYHGEKWAEYGDEKMQWMFAHRSFLDHGIRVAGASDYPPGPFEPLMAIQSMVTRKDYKGREWGSNQRITVAQALQVATVNGAYASYEETEKGSITPGKLADFVMLERDPHETDPETIKDIKVLRTVVGGRTMHPKSETD
ncbi:MAG: amidohydrolase [Bryobacterales bacterium]|nr:amidohydrolase [Bryobacterales bacterium]